MGEEAIAPRLERVGVVQPQDLDVGDEEPEALDRASTSDSARDVAAGEDVFLDPGIGGARRLGAADRMQRHDAVVLEQAADRGEEFVVGARPTCSNMPTETMRSKCPSTSR